MKKIMFAAAAVALAGIASASTAYDYRASVKYVDMKRQSIHYNNGIKEVFEVKVVRSTTLAGYLVTTADCGCTFCGAEGLKPGFLVVMNKKAKTGVKILPANLLSYAWSTKKNLADGMYLQAEGYLFAGIGKQAVPAEASPVYEFGDKTTGATKKLFGTYNDEKAKKSGFVEAWLDASGFGTAKWSVEANYCDKDTSGYCLYNLQGSVIGGMFLCKESAGEAGFICQSWAGTTDVITGTWKIKANAALKGVALSAVEAESLKVFEKDDEDDMKELELVKAAGQKLDKAFNLEKVDKVFCETWF